MPVDTYSAGMRARLAFGACLAIDFDVYLIDEVTEIGDERFRRKCAAAFRERLRSCDVILATHNHHTSTTTTRSGSTVTAEPSWLAAGCSCSTAWRARSNTIAPC